MRIINALIGLIPAVHGLAQGAVTVSIQAGNIVGSICPATAVNSFTAIPYAQPPIGNLRFAAPVPYSGSFPNGSIMATARAPPCIQFGTAFVLAGPSSEDCLYLDIWTPANATTGSKLPVKVWVYGGGDDAGGISDPLYNGCNLATDSIVVSISYRVGALGFLALETAGITGNFGVQDILLGLEWVQQNIAAFGGDPTKVLLFGQSAGGRLTWIVSSLPQASSLINAAIPESGAGRTLVKNDEYQAYGVIYANALGCNVRDIACFRAAPANILNASAPVTPATTITAPDKFQPYLDGKIIPAEPLTVGSKVPLLSGTTTMEGTLFTAAQFTSPASITETDYTSFLQSNFGPLASLVAQYYPLSLFATTPFPAFYAISTVITYNVYFCPTRLALLATLNASVPVWNYYDAHTPSCGWEPGLGGPSLQLLGPTHTSEIPFVFGQLTNLPLPNGTCSFDAQEVAISKVLISAWTSMAETGSPDRGVGVLGGPWPRWNGTGSQGLLIGNASAIGYINYTICDFWDNIEALSLNASMSANGTNVVNASSSAGAYSTSTGSISTATGDGTIVRTSFWSFAIIALAVVFAVLLLASGA